MPPLERGERVGLAELGAWRTKPLFAELDQGIGKLAAVELAACQGSDDFAAKQRYRLGVVFGAEIFHWQRTPRAAPHGCARGRARSLMPFSQPSRKRHDSVGAVIGPVIAGSSS